MGKIRFPTQWEASNIIKGLTPDEIAEGIVIQEWDCGHLKYKILDDHIEWTTIYVEQSYRDQGYGVKIIEWVENKARELGYKYVTVMAYTNGKDDILGRFLTKLNYVNVSTFHFKKDV